MDSKKVGVLAIFGASLAWSIEPVCAKLAYDANSTFLEISAIRAIFVTITAFVYVCFVNKANFKITISQLPKLIYIAIIGTVVADLLYFYALTRIPVINAVLIGHGQPIFIILIGFFILREDVLTKHDYIGIAIMIVGGLAVATKTIDNLLAFKFGTKGDAVVLLATVAWATTAIVMRKYLKHLNPGVITFYRYTIATVVLVVWVAATSSVKISNIYEPLVGIVVGIGTILYYIALKRLKAAQTSALELSTPFFSAILAFMILKEAVTVMQAMGVMLLVVGVYCLSRKEQTPF